MKARFTAEAARGLDHAVEFFLEHAPDLAAEFVDLIAGAVAELKDHPYSAPETEMPGIRRKYIRRFRYILFYAVDEAEGDVVIVDVRHAMRRWPWEES